jgi:uncharacterized membrane protein
MSQEEKIKELQEKIHGLSADINSSLHQLRALQAELNILKQNSGEKTGNEIQPLRNKNIPASSSPAQAPLGVENFIGLKLMHLVGIVVLVTGISIGVKYAIDKELISEAVRILLAYAAGVLLFILSIQLKKKYQLFSAILFSGSMASIYFTTYAAFVYYHFFPLIIAFVLMVGLTIYTVIKAISYDRKEIAIIGMVGAYAIPFLISSKAERVDLFFSYILLINAGIVFLSFKKRWKLMSYLALLITWILFIGWGLIKYVPSQQGVAIIFMVLFYVLFLVNALVFRFRNKIELALGEIQQILINNTALYIAAIIVLNDGAIVGGLAAITGGMFLVTGLLAFTSSRMFSSEIVLQRLLTWQSLILLLLFILFQWDGLAVTLLWVMVSVILFVWGIVAQKSWARLASVLLIGITLVKLLVFDSLKFSTGQKISCYIIIGILLLIFSFYYQKLGLTQKKESN